MTTLVTITTFGTNAASLPTGWVDYSGEDGWRVVSTTADGDGVNPGFSYYNTTDMASQDHWVEVTVGGTIETASDNGAGGSVRMATADGVFIQGNTTQTRIYKRISNVYTQMGSDGPAVAIGDKLYLEVQGSTIVAKKNATLGVGGTSICGSPIDGSGGTGLPAGTKIGMWVSNNHASMEITRLDAGNFITPGVGGGPLTGGLANSILTEGRLTA